ncbi:spondin domain-containing protein [Teredinibacter sp. KSP-S5-2]|uniref:spondin domain-containing protein n=1 Tax=Teredinibacter sp. KSP-S5-2 TaxID=3034506 RepID=UPI0029345FA0|nr:spondin domain-containing protein [Teredinibacter sp. KSP-S5-2]WNO08941.1 spondin domain-containing protein [Teredinibacter sp. KSP-S5-2]
MNGLGTLIKICLLICIPLAFTACGGDDNDDEVRSLESRVAELQMQLDQLAVEDTSLANNLAAINTRLEALENDATVASEIAEIQILLDDIAERIAALTAAAKNIYRITLTNLTENQPLAPAAVLLHGADYSAWNIGEAATDGLETLAESGDPTEVIAEASNAISAKSSEAVLAPGDSLVLNISGLWQEDLSLTLVSMLVNTNDAFAGANTLALSHLRVGEQFSYIAPIYDAGTERNTETAETIPGPAGGGEGLNRIRDDVANQVTMHPGVVSQDDGYAQSALDSSHRFDQGALKIDVARME